MNHVHFYDMERYAHQILVSVQNCFVCLRLLLSPDQRVEL